MSAIPIPYEMLFKTGQHFLKILTKDYIQSATNRPIRVRTDAYVDIKNRLYIAYPIKLEIPILKRCLSFFHCSATFSVPRGYQFHSLQLLDDNLIPRSEYDFAATKSTDGSQTIQINPKKLIDAYGANNELEIFIVLLTMSADEIERHLYMGETSAGEFVVHAKNRGIEYLGGRLYHESFREKKYTTYSISDNCGFNENSLSFLIRGFQYIKLYDVGIENIPKENYSSDVFSLEHQKEKDYRVYDIGKISPTQTVILRK